MFSVQGSVVGVAGLLAAAALSFGARGALGQTITVNWSQDDFVDFGGAQQVADLPGPDGLVTFSEAVIAANNTPGPQTIEFAVPQSDWWTVLGNDRCYFYHTLMAYVSGDDTTIDFTTQTAFTGDTNPAGNEVAFYYAGAPTAIPNIWLAGNRITVKGLDRLIGNNFQQGIWITGNDCRVIGCTTTGLTIRGDYGGGARNIIGGTGTGDGNTFSSPTNILSRANGNIVLGNIFRYGLRVSGDPLNGTCDDNRIGGPTLAERNVFTGHGYSAEEGLPAGTELEIYHAKNTRVEGNFVGTSDDGLSGFAGRVGATGIGVGIGAVNTLIEGNTVGGIQRTGGGHYQGLRFGVGMAVVASANGTTIRDNRIGVGVDGTTPILNVQGITVQSDPNGTPFDTTIENNIITTSETTGVRVLFSGSARITRNAIFGNGALGIDLWTAGVTPNDPLDADSGPNGLQNFPEITGARADTGSVRITGTLSSAPGRVFVVEFFNSPTCDESGNGEGAVYLGSETVSTDADGVALIDATLAATAGLGSVVTSTAIDATTGNSSEFSACRAVESFLCGADFNADGFVNGDDFDGYVLAFEAGDTGADFDGNGFVAGDDFDAFVAVFESGC